MYLLPSEKVEVDLVEDDAGRESIKVIPHASEYRAIHVRDVTFEFEFWQCTYTI